MDVTGDGAGVAAERVGKAFGRSARPVLRDVELRVRRGGSAAVIGPAGSGKTVLLRCLSGAERPSRGSVRIGAVDLGGLDERARGEFRRDRIGVLSPDGDLAPELPVRDNVLLPLDLAGRRADPELLAEALDRMAVRDLLDRRPHRLGRADRLRVALVRELVRLPEVLLVDEPVLLLDAVTGRHLLRLLDRCGRAFGLAVVLFSRTAATSVYADQVLALRDGRAVPQRGSAVQEQARIA